MFALRVVKLVRSLAANPADQVIARQLVRCGTSIGANVEEAQGAHSKVDFIRRMNIARAEARETLYWLRLVAETGMIPKTRMRELVPEAEAIVRILVKIVKTAKESRDAKE